MRGICAGQYATFVSRSPITRYMIVFAVLLQAVPLSGCVWTRGVPAQRYEQAEALVEQGLRSLRDQRLADAQSAFSMAYDLVPLAAALDGQGCVAFVRGDTNEAEVFFRRAYKSDKGYYQALAHLALLYDVTGRRDEARRMYDEVLEREPEAAQVRNNRAAMEFERGGDRQWVAQELSKASLLLPDGVVTENLLIMGLPQRKQYGQESR